MSTYLEPRARTQQPGVLPSLEHKQSPDRKYTYLQTTRSLRRKLQLFTKEFCIFVNSLFLIEHLLIELTFVMYRVESYVVHVHLIALLFDGCISD